MANKIKEIDSKREDLSTPGILSLWTCIWMRLGNWEGRPLAWKSMSNLFASSFSHIDLWKPTSGVPPSLYSEQNHIRHVNGIHNELHSLSRGHSTKIMMGNQPSSPHLHLFSPWDFWEHAYSNPFCQHRRQWLISSPVLLAVNISLANINLKKHERK